MVPESETWMNIFLRANYHWIISVQFKCSIATTDGDFGARWRTEIPPVTSYIANCANWARVRTALSLN